MSFSDIVAIGSILIGVIVCIIISHNEKSKRKVLQGEIEKLKKSIEQDETKTDIELRISRLKELAHNVVEEINDNTEDKLNTLSNKKIMEFEEYANQVLEKIDINHKEVMFLYDMLNDKVSEVNKIIEKLGEKEIAIIDEINEVKPKKVDNHDKISISKDLSVDNINKNSYGFENQEFRQLLESLDEKMEDEIKVTEEESFEEISIGSILKEEAMRCNTSNDNYSTSDTLRDEGLQIKVESYDMKKEQPKLNEYQKRNEQIIKLYSLGYSTVDISKKLGIGTGEVALINNLYHDRMVVAE